MSLTLEPGYHIMLDLETMGKAPDAAIIAVGAAAFDFCSPYEITSTFYHVVSLKSSVTAGGVIDAGTVLWWMNQSENARNAILDVPAFPIEFVLREFSAWAVSNANEANIIVWGNGAAFDNVILKGAYERLRIPPPWSYKNDRCYRTAMAMFPHHVALTFEGIKHSALHDATYQAKNLMEAVLRSKQR